MLRGVNGRRVPVTGALIFDIPKSDLLHVVKDASGGMLPADGVPARDQVLAGICGRFPLRESADSSSNNRHHSHDSQRLILRSHKEQFTQDVIPRRPGRGPIEALLEEAEGVEIIAAILIGEFEGVPLTVLQLRDDKVRCRLGGFEVGVKLPPPSAGGVVVGNRGARAAAVFVPVNLRDRAADLDDQWGTVFLHLVDEPYDCLFVVKASKSPGDADKIK